MSLSSRPSGGEASPEVVFSLAARTVTTNSAAFPVGNPADQVTLFTRVTAASGTTPTLNVKLQESPDGTNWYDVGVASTNLTGVSTQRFVATYQSSNVGGLSAIQYRVVATIGGTTPSFTFETIVVLASV